jgi:hypothetical protein
MPNPCFRFCFLVQTRASANFLGNVMDEEERLLPVQSSPIPQVEPDMQMKVTCKETCVACLFPPRGGNFVDALLNKPWYLRALRFLPALLLTLGLELVKGNLPFANSQRQAENRS